MTDSTTRATDKSNAKKAAKQKAEAATIPGATYTDQTGSFSQLLYATLVRIGNWDPNAIHIEQLPLDLYSNLSAIAQGFIDQNEVTDELLTTFFQQIVGSSAGPDTSKSTDSTANVSGIDGSVADIVWKVGVAMGEPNKALLAAMITGIIESNMQNLDTASSDGYGSYGWRQEQASLYGGKAAVLDVNASAKRYYKEINAMMTGKVLGKGSPSPGYYQSDWSAGKLAQAVQGSGTPGKYYGTEGDWVAKGTALYNQMLKKFPPGKGATTALTTPSPLSSSLDDALTTVKGGSAGSGNAPTPAATQKTIDKLLAAANLDGADAGFTPIQNLAKSYGLNNFTGKSGQHVSGSEHYLGHAMDFALAGVNPSPGDPDVPQLAKLYKFIIDNLLPMTHQVIYRNNIWTDGVKAVYNATDHYNHVHVSLKGKYLTDKNSVAQAIVNALNGTPLGGGAATTSDDDGGVASVASGGEAGAFALAAQLNLPGTMDRTAAALLTGDKALMNDVTLFPFIQQLCEASLRSFQSLPDGSFHAFYPDYFGETYHRPPYWNIANIEILDGKINLSDDPLVTHMYVVGSLGPTALVGSSVGDMFNELQTAGVVTIYNAFLSNAVLTDDDSDTTATNGTTVGSGSTKANAAGKKAKATSSTPNPTKIFGKGLMKDKVQAGNFLQRYGARVEVNDNQFIYNRYFELFVAYQNFLLAWSRQFVTPFTFTFMPELYPGGKVSFNDHGIQMYIEEVTHEFDYSTGFTTSANLSAPSVLGTTKGSDPVALNPDLPANMAAAIIAPVGDMTSSGGPN